MCEVGGSRRRERLRILACPHIKVCYENTNGPSVNIVQDTRLPSCLLRDYEESRMIRPCLDTSRQRVKEQQNKCLYIAFPPMDSFKIYRNSSYKLIYLLEAYPRRNASRCRLCTHCA